MCSFGKLEDSCSHYESTNKDPDQYFDPQEPRSFLFVHLDVAEELLDAPEYSWLGAETTLLGEEQHTMRRLLASSYRAASEFVPYRPGRTGIHGGAAAAATRARWHCSLASPWILLVKVLHIKFSGEDRPDKPFFFGKNGWSPLEGFFG